MKCKIVGTTERGRHFDHEYASVDEFLEYSRGLSPDEATVTLHLRCRQDAYDVRKVAKHLNECYSGHPSAPPVDPFETLGTPEATAATIELLVTRLLSLDRTSLPAAIERLASLNPPAHFLVRDLLKNLQPVV